MFAVASVLLASSLSAITAPVSASATTNPTCASTMTAQNNLTLTPSHSSVFYIDSGVAPKVDAAYVAYNISNSSASARTNVWVQLSNFAGGKVTLANPADAAQEISIPANGNATAFFLLKATGATTTAQSHTVKVWTARPDISGSSALATCDYSFSKVSETIKASANKITAVTGALSPATATLGGTYTITVTGFTGKIGSGYAPDNAAIWASPAAYSSFPTRALRLESTTIHWADGSCPADVVNQLYYKFNTSDNCFKGNGANWTGTYRFRIIGTGPAALAPSPVANISSGNQYKHSDLSGISNTSVNLSGVASSNVAVNVSASGTPVSSTANSVTIRYLVTISTTSTVALNVDEVIDIHDSGTTFVSGSAKAGTNSASLGSIADPTVLSADVGKTPPPYHFIGPFSAVSGTPYYIQYDYTIPCLATTTSYGTKVVAYTGDVLIGASSTTISTSTVTTSTGAACSSPTVNNGSSSMNPSIVTSTADSITANAANINAYGNAAGLSGVQYQFKYSTDSNLVNSVTTTALASITGSTAIMETAALSGLSPNTTYYYQALIRDSSGNFYKGLILSFTTAAQAATPTVVTSSATGITGSNVTLNGSVNANLTAITSVDFYYCRDLSLTTSCVTKNVVTDDGTGAAISLTFSTSSAGVTVVSSDSITGAQQITTLSSGTTYYYRLQISCTYNSTTNAYCPNTSSPQVVGTTLSFTAGAPTAITSDASDVGSATATLNGSVNANNASTAISFCLTGNSASTNGVLTAANCTSVAGSPASLSNNVTTSVTGSATGLSGNTVYYFQVKAVSGSYTSYGSIFSFTTLAITSSTPLTSGQVNSAYNFSFAGAGGSGSYTWSTTSTLPTGLTLSSTGLLSGTPTTAGSYSIDVVMTDPLSGQTVTKTFTLVINDNVNITASTTAASYVTGVGATVPTVGGSASPSAGISGSLTCNVYAASDTSYAAVVTLNSNTAAGSYVVHCTGTAAAGYVLGTNTNATITVTAPTNVNITASTSAASYVTGVGATVPTIGGSASPAGGITGSLTCNVYAASDTSYAAVVTLNSNTAAGSYVVHCTGTAAAGYVLGTNTNATITVNNPGSVTFAATAASFTTGNNETVPTFSGTANPTAGLSGSLTCRVYTSSDSGYATPLSITSNYAAGTYVIHCTGSASSGYVLAGNNNATLTIYSMHQAATVSATNITFKSALLRGSVTAGTGGLASTGITSLVICYSTSNTLVAGKLSVTPVCSTNIWNTTAVTATNTGNYSISAGNLTPGNTYYSQIQVVYQSGVAQNGTPLAFTVLNQPGAGTNAASKVSSRGAIIHGAINPQKNRLTKVSFCWGTDPTLGTCADDNLGSTTWWTDGTTNTDQTVSATLTGLAPHTTYYYRAYLVADDGGITGMSFRPRASAPTAQGSIQNFTTAWAETTSTTSVTATTATLNGTLHAGSVDIANADVTSVLLCYSTSNALDANGVFSGTQVCSSSLWTGTSAISANGTLNFTAPVSGLTPGQTYYSQIQVVFASTGTATANGGAVQFATPGTVTFHANYIGSTQPDTSQTSAISASLTLNAFTRTGYSFAGWATTSGGSIAYHDGDLYGFVGASNLYAIWTINNYTVTFNNHDGSASPATSNVSLNYNADAIPSGPAVTRTGYTLVGWNTDPNATIGLISYTVTGSTTLYAIWQGDTYTVTYDANTASSGSAPGSQTFTVGSSSAIALPGVGSMAKTVGSDVYTFGGWSLSAGTSGAGGAAIASPFTPASSVTLYAIWHAPGAKTVTFHTNYPSGSGDTTSTQSSTSATNLAGNTFSATGYTFAGWATASGSNTVAYQDGDSYPFTADGDLYAVWTADTYTVTWNTAINGGSTNTTASFTVGGSALTVPVPAARAGYTFTGWYTAATGGSTFASISGSVLSPSTYTPTASIEFFARWTLNSYTVTYLKNDGSTASTTDTVNYGSDALPRVNPWTRTGYSFLGWSESASGAVITTRTVTGDVSLYAIWAGDVYTITWDTHTNGGANNTSSSFTVGGSALSIPTPVARTGYTFTGWYTLASGGTQLASYSGSNFNPASFSPSQSATYYAYWTINSYDITFSKNDGSTSPLTTVVSIVYATDAIPSAPTYSRTGYSFAGWSTSANGTNVSSYTATGSATLYALWTPNQYTITYNANTASGAAPSAGSYTVGTTGVTLPGASGMTLVVNGATYTFGGWSETPGANGAGGSAVADPYQATSNITLYAIWVAPGANTVTFHSNYPVGSNSTSTQSSNVPTALAPNTFAYSGYTFAGWNTVAGGTGVAYSAGANYNFAAGLDLYAQWTADQYVVTWNTLTNGGGANTSANFTYGGSPVSIPLPTARSGYTFNGWYTAATGGSPVATYNGSTLSMASYTPSSTITLYAQWTAITNHTVTFHANFGSDSTTTQQSNTNANLTANGFTRSGYIFSGWATNPDGTGTVYANQAAFGFANDLVLYAQWSAISQGGPAPTTTYLVTLNYLGGSGGANSYWYTVGGSGVVLPGASKLGYVFGGWSTECPGGSSVANPYVATGNVTLCAIWLPAVISFTITFNYQGGSGSVSSLTYTSTSGALVLPAGTKSHYSLGGWSLSPAGQLVASPFTPTADVTLFAQWVADVYTVTLEANPNTEPEVIKYTYGTDPVSLPVAIPINGKFLGWAISGTRTIISTSTIAPVSNVALYGVYTVPQMVTTVYFGGDSAVLKSAAKSTLTNLVLKLKKYIHVWDISSTGWVKKTSDTSYDKKLALARAKAVTNFLKSLGIKANFTTSANVVAPQDNATARRVEIVSK